MVVRIDGQVARSRTLPTWPVWLGPMAVLALIVAGTVFTGYYQAWGYAPEAVAAIHTAGFVAMAWPFLGLVRDVEIGRFGLEAHFYRGTSRYLRFYEIREVTMRPHSGILPSRICVEDVYGRKLHLRGDRALLASVSAALDPR